MPSSSVSTIGRFAPSPTGNTHFGTLLAATASYLQAKSSQGKWLVRIEDIDVTRSVPGADTAILHTLENYGFEWDGEIVYQSTRTHFYEQALEILIENSRVFPCQCTRKQLTSFPHNVYPGTCRHRQLGKNRDDALRLRCDSRQIDFNDGVLGWQHADIDKDCGDFIIKRRDGLFAYQLAVVVDDALQGVTEVVRGVDLLDSTPWQIYLQQLLGYPQPTYLHIPLAIDDAGNKLSKSRGAASIENRPPVDVLLNVLSFLGQQPPTELSHGDIDILWKWAIENWQVDRIPKQAAIAIRVE